MQCINLTGGSEKNWDAYFLFDCYYFAWRELRKHCNKKFFLVSLTSYRHERTCQIEISLFHLFSIELQLSFVYSTTHPRKKQSNPLDTLHRSLKYENIHPTLLFLAHEIPVPSLGSARAAMLCGRGLTTNLLIIITTMAQEKIDLKPRHTKKVLCAASEFQKSLQFNRFNASVTRADFELHATFLV